MRNKYHRRAFMQCDCGNIVDVALPSVKKGDTKSCGCFKLKHSHSVGGVTSSTYICWRNMKSRCVNPNSKAFPYYGGRGIKVCDRWLESFANFLEDMGVRPEGKTIDRIDSNGNYEPGNCKWSTVREQQNNRRITLSLTYNGITKTLSHWAEEYGMSLDVLYKRVTVHKWSAEKALETPCKKRKSKNKVAND